MIFKKWDGRAGLLWLIMGTEERLINTVINLRIP
jgi:hypothetical protein